MGWNDLTPTTEADLSQAAKTFRQHRMEHQMTQQMQQEDDVRYILYHKEKAPHGREFLMSRDGPPEYWAKSQGYVDTAAKHGINLWGPDHEEAVRRIERLFNAGKLKAIDDPTFVSDETQEQMDKLLADKQALEEQLRQSEELRTQMQRSNEELKDAISDASKEADPDRSATTPVGTDLTPKDPGAGGGEGQPETPTEQPIGGQLPPAQTPMEL